MRFIPPSLQAKLDSGVTTLARCWRIARRDGVVLGFTDHDEDVVLDGLTCRADEGLMVHAHDGACVAEVAIAPWWRRRLAYAFRFPGVIED